MATERQWRRSERRGLTAVMPLGAPHDVLGGWCQTRSRSGLQGGVIAMLPVWTVEDACLARALLTVFVSLACCLALAACAETPEPAEATLQSGASYARSAAGEGVGATDSAEVRALAAKIAPGWGRWEVGASQGHQDDYVTWTAVSEVRRVHPRVHVRLVLSFIKREGRDQAERWRHSEWSADYLVDRASEGHSGSSDASDAAEIEVYDRLQPDVVVAIADYLAEGLPATEEFVRIGVEADEYIVTTVDARGEERLYQVRATGGGWTHSPL